MKILICGMGSIGVRHFRNLQTLGVTDIIFYSTRKSTFPQIEEIMQGAQVFDSLHDALAEMPDICMITNPTSLHVRTAIEAAKHGCHLYIEKPISHTLEGLEELNRLIEMHNLISFVTYQFRFHPHIKLLCELVKQKDVYGDVIWARAEWSEYLPDWHPWEDYTKGYSARSELGGGVLRTQIHPLNYLSFILGEISELSVHCQASGHLGIDVDDLADIHLSFENNVTANVHVDYLQKPRVHTLTVVTNKGRFAWDCHANELFFIDHAAKRTHFPNENFERNDMFVSMLEHFLHCVETGKQSAFTVKEATSELSKLLNAVKS